MHQQSQWAGQTGVALDPLPHPVGPQTAETLALASDDAEGTVYLMTGDLRSHV